MPAGWALSRKQKVVTISRFLHWLRIKPAGCDTDLVYLAPQRRCPPPSRFSLLLRASPTMLHAAYSCSFHCFVPPPEHGPYALAPFTCISACLGDNFAFIRASCTSSSRQPPRKSQAKARYRQDPGEISVRHLGWHAASFARKGISGHGTNL